MNNKTFLRKGKVMKSKYVVFILAEIAILISFNTALLCKVHAEEFFFSPIEYDVGYYPYDIATNDFNEDGHIDLAIGTAGSGDVTILIGNGDGSFQLGGCYEAGSGELTNLAIGDFDEDGHQDLAVANHDDENVSILIGNGDGSFQAAVYYEMGDDTESIAIGDFNNDGHQDLAIGRVWISNCLISNNHIMILLGNGDGSFELPMEFSVDSPWDISIGDFNEDGYSDIAVANGNLSILNGNGDGSFENPWTYWVGGIWTYFLTVGDFNGDAHLDIVTSNDQHNKISVFLGNGDGHIQDPFYYSVGEYPTDVVVGDFNEDNCQDLAVANYSDISILLGNGDGTFQEPVNHNAGNLPVFIAVDDFDEDGHQDLAVTNFFTQKVSILINVKEDSCFINTVM